MHSLLGGMIVVVALINSAHAQTNPSIVLYSGTAQQLSHISTDFQVERSSGQAWINLFVSQGFHTEDRYEQQISVDGLRYDSQTQQVVYTSTDGTKVVCANATSRGQGWRQRNQITPTGRCPIATQPTDVSTARQARVHPSEPVNIVLTPLLGHL